MFDEHELVVLARDLPEYELVAGDVGTVVGSYGNGGYEVEFMTAEGRTIAVATLSDTDIRRCTAREILHVRSVTPA
jgi:hypothetical protein